MEKREIIRRLKLEQSIRGIHRDTGFSRELIREIKILSENKGWLTSPELPTEKEISMYTDIKKCHPLDKIKNKIKEWVKCGYTYVVITILIKEHSFNYNEITVRRYIQKNFPQTKRPVNRRTFNPGEIAEIDFGYLGLMYVAEEKRKRKVWFFSMRLNYSRKCYREIVLDQKKETFFLCHIHAFEYFGGVPKKIVCDNLKAAVLEASLQDPLVNKSYRMLAEHYNFLISATQPGKPEHKGGVEKDMDYVKRNFYPLFIEHQKKIGRDVPHFEDCIIALEKWTKEVDDQHVIKYTNSTPEELFTEEKNFLLPVSSERWDLITWYTRKVGDDWKVQLNKAFYSVPYKYTGKEVTAYSNSKEVVIFYEYEEIARHSKAIKHWEKISKEEHSPPEYKEYLLTTSTGLRQWANILGDSVGLFVEKLLTQKGVDGLRPARGVCGLAKKYGNDRLGNACTRALHYNLSGLRSIKTILEKELDIKFINEVKKNQKKFSNDITDQKQYKHARDSSYYNIQ